MSDFSSVNVQKRSSGCGCAGCGLAALSVGIVVILLALLGFRGLERLAKFAIHLAQEEPQSAGIGKQLAVVDLVSLDHDGEMVSRRDLEGKVVLMAFWGTWCGPCQVEIPEIAEIGKKFGDRDDFRLLAVSCGQGLDENLAGLSAQTHKFLQDEDLVLPCFADPNSVTRNAVNEAAGFTGYPTTLILDRKGTIRGVWTGYREGATGDMQRLIEELLKEE